MKVYVVYYDYMPTESLWGDEYYPETILLKVYQDENKAEEFCNYCNKLIENFYEDRNFEEEAENYDSEVLEDYFDKRRLLIIYNGEEIMEIYKDHEEDGNVYYIEMELE